jgi:hypothetical protein
MIEICPKTIDPTPHPRDFGINLSYPLPSSPGFSSMVSWKINKKNKNEDKRKTRKCNGNYKCYSRRPNRSWKINKRKKKF